MNGKGPIVGQHCHPAAGPSTQNFSSWGALALFEHGYRTWGHLGLDKAHGKGVVLKSMLGIGHKDVENNARKYEKGTIPRSVHLHIASQCLFVFV